ncbi:MAG TPA: aldo/keto reductase [Acidobacteriaceae bacterium]
MKRRTLGHTGFEVSEIGYGMWGMSGWSGSEEAQSLQSLQLAVDLGCTFFDTAWAYGNGQSDHYLGRTLAANPGKQLVAASKVPPLNGCWPALPSYRYAEAFPKTHVLACVNQMREALQQDSVDVLQFHVWDDSWTDDPEFRATVETLKRDGLIRAFGLSLNRWQPENGLRAIRSGLVDVVQVVYNIFDQSPDDELFPLCREMNIGVIARVPLDEGSLSGHFTAATTFPEGDWRARYFNTENLAATLVRVDHLKKIVPEGMSLPELALRFILANPAVSTLIAGMRTPAHVRSNIACGDGNPLSPELLQELKKHRWNRKPAHVVS